jgi:hypothetical protein
VLAVLATSAEQNVVFRYLFDSDSHLGIASADETQAFFSWGLLQ